MGIENFLNDLQNQDDELANRKKEALQAKQDLENADKKYLEEFRIFYTQNLYPLFDKIKGELESKFDLSYTDPEIMQLNNYLAQVFLVPKFDNGIKKLIIQFTAEGGRRLISISGQIVNDQGQSMGDGIHNFQGPNEEFLKLNIEEEISNILAKAFIRK